MQVLQLYIEGQRVDLFKDESVSITQTIQNVKDISKVFTDFSKTFNLPASKTNNKIFKHYYNYNIDDGFDARKKKSANLELNNIPFKKGKIKLEGVTLKEGKPHTYKVTFFGNTVNLKDLLGEDTLSSLEWLDNFNNEYNATEVQGALENGIDKTVDTVTYSNALVAPLISHTTRLYYDSVQVEDGNLYPASGNGVLFDQLKYAIPIHIIIKAIEETYGITFSNDFFTNSNLPYYNLYMWLHRKKGNAFDEGQPITTLVTGFPVDTYPLQVEGAYSNGSSFQISGMTSPTQMYYVLSVYTSTLVDYSIIIKKDGVIYRQENVVGGGDYNFTGYLTNSSSGYQVFLYSTSALSISYVSMYLLNGSTLVDKNYDTSPFTTTTTQSFIITEQIPKMKVIDFLTGLFKMFNLTAYYEDDIIVVKTLDNYYSNSNTTWDITKYVLSNEANVDIALPFKEVDFGYEGLGTKLALQHQQTNNQEWGTVEYQGDDNYDSGGDIYSVKAPFEHLKYERLIDNSTSTTKNIQVGWFVDDNNDPYFGSPLLFYPISVTSGDTIRFSVDNVGTFNDITNYHIPSNSLSLLSTTSAKNINFNLELNEYTADNTFDETLFAEYYQTYIEEVFNAKLRLTKVKAYLPISFLLNYTLADKVQILDKIYKINSIESNLETGESSLELLNTTTALPVFVPTPTPTPVPSPTPTPVPTPTPTPTPVPSPTPTPTPVPSPTPTPTPTAPPPTAPPPTVPTAPPEYAYFIATECGGSTTKQFRSYTSFYIGQGVSFEGDSNCYEVTGTTVTVNYLDWDASYTDCTDCLPAPTPPPPTATLPTFTCSDAVLVVENGIIGESVTANVTLGTINLISPDTYQSGAYIYTANIEVPSGYANTGSSINCQDIAEGTSVPTAPPPTAPPTAPPPPTEYASCDNPVSISESGSGYPYTYEVIVGSEIGTVDFTYQPFGLPDKFVVTFDGVQVINTGYVGVNNPTIVNRLNSALANIGEPTGETITETNNNSTTVSFYKGSTTTTLIVEVYAPIDGTEFEFVVSCPTPPSGPASVWYQMTDCADSSTKYSQEYTEGDFAINDRVTSVGGITLVITGQLLANPGGILYAITSTGQTGCP